VPGRRDGSVRQNKRVLTRGVDLAVRVQQSLRGPDECRVRGSARTPGRRDDGSVAERLRWDLPEDDMREPRAPQDRCSVQPARGVDGRSDLRARVAVPEHALRDPTGEILRFLPGSLRDGGRLPDRRRLPVRSVLLQGVDMHALRERGRVVPRRRVRARSGVRGLLAEGVPGRAERRRVVRPQRAVSGSLQRAEQDVLRWWHMPRAGHGGGWDAVRRGRDRLHRVALLEQEMPPLQDRRLFLRWDGRVPAPRGVRRRQMRAREHRVQVKI